MEQEWPHDQPYRRPRIGIRQRVFRIPPPPDQGDPGMPINVDVGDDAGYAANGIEENGNLDGGQQPPADAIFRNYGPQPYIGVQYVNPGEKCRPFDNYTQMMQFIAVECFGLSRSLFDHLSTMMKDRDFQPRDWLRSWKTVRSLRRRIPTMSELKVGVDGEFKEGVVLSCIESIVRFLSSPENVRHAHFVPRLGTVVKFLVVHSL